MTKGIFCVKKERGGRVKITTVSPSGVPRNFVGGVGGGVQQIQLRTDRTGFWRQ